MNSPQFQRKCVDKILFVWDGTSDHVAQVAAITAQKNTRIVAVHAMPHESIYSYGLILNEENEPGYAERALHRRFAEAMKPVAKLKRLRLRLLFGDRITEIIRFADANKVSSILIPRFCQSNFSKWIHGDLNERLIDKANCPVLFLESEHQRTVKSATQSKTNS